MSCRHCVDDVVAAHQKKENARLRKLLKSYRRRVKGCKVKLAELIYTVKKANEIELAREISDELKSRKGGKEKK